MKLSVEYTAAERRLIGGQAAGKTVRSLEWSESDDGGDGYWVMTFTDDTEICFSRMMAELARNGIAGA